MKKAFQMVTFFGVIASSYWVYKSEISPQSIVALISAIAVSIGSFFVKDKGNSSKVNGDSNTINQTSSFGSNDSDIKGKHNNITQSNK
jgi:hypothetical protein